MLTKSPTALLLYAYSISLLFQVNVEAKEFIGLSRVKQHRLVTDTLKTEIAGMHGIRIHTTIPGAGDK